MEARLSGPVSYASRNSSNWRGFYRQPEESSPVKTPAIGDRGIRSELVIPVAGLKAAHVSAIAPDRGGDPEEFQYWKEKLDRLKRKVRR